MARRLAFASVIAIGIATLGASALQSQGPGQAGGLSPSAGGSGPVDAGGPESRDARASSLTGRIIVKFTEDSGLIAPIAPSPFPVASEAGDSIALNSALIATGSTVTRWIAQPDEVLLELTARAAANSGKPQPDLRKFAYIDPPAGSVLDTADALSQVPELEWVFVERMLVIAQDGQGCGGPDTPPCWEPDCPDVNGCNPDPGCNFDPPDCQFGCQDATCCARVGAILPSCIDSDGIRGWDPVCAELANMVCEGDPGNNYGVTKADQFSYFLTSDCFQARGYVANGYLGGCSNLGCANAVCLVDPYCCTLEWDSACVEMAASEAFRAACGSPIVRDPTPDFTARVELVTEEAVLGGLNGGAVIAYEALRARGLQTYTVGEPVVGFDRFTNVVEPQPDKKGEYTGDLAFLNSGFRGLGLDLEKMRALATDFSAKSGSSTRLNGAGIRVGVIDFAYDENHEEFVCAAQVPGSATGECADFYDVPRVIPEPGQTPWSSLPAAERGHGTAVLAMLVAGDNGFGVTGIAHEAQGYFYPASSVEQGFRLQNAFVSMLLEFEAGDVCLIPMAFAPDDGIGPNEIFSQPIVTSPAYATLISVGSAIGVQTVVPAGNSSAPTQGEPDGIDSQALVVGAAMPGQLLVDGISPLGWQIWEFTRVPSSNFIGEDDPTAIDLFAWGSNIVTAGGLGDLFSGQRPASDPSYARDYTDSFGGTSGAASMIAGAAAVLQGFSFQELGLPASPRLLSKVLRNNGVPQGGWPFGSPEYRGVVPGAPASVLPTAPPEADDVVPAALGFSDFGRANFPQLVEAANDLIFEANDCEFGSLDPATPDPVSPDGGEGLQIEVNLGGGIGDGENCSWYVVSTEPWIVITTGSGTGAQLDNFIRYDVAPNNETVEARDGEIIFIGGNVTVPIPIVQQGCGLVVVPAPQVFAADGTTAGLALPAEIELQWNGLACEWTASTTDPWINLVISSGTGAAPENILAFEVAASDLAIPRTGFITITSSAGIEYEIEVVQNPCAIVEVVPPAPVFPPDGTTVGFGDPAEVQLTWTSESCGWTADSPETWITVLTPAGTGAPLENVIRYAVAPSDEQLARQGIIRVTSTGGAIFNIIVTQAPCALVATVPPAPAFPPDGTTGGFGDPAELTLVWDGESCGWTATSTVPWITVVTGSGSGAPLENLVRYDVAPNPTQVPREGRIRVESAGGAVNFVVITQASCVLQATVPAAPAFPPDGTTGGFGDPAELTLVWDGEACGWTATSTVPWITVVTGSGSGAPLENVVRYDVAPNATQLPRQGRIRIQSDGGALTLVDVTQGACGLAAVEPPVSNFGPDGTTGGFGDPAEVELIWDGEACSWTASTTDAWITVLTSSGTGAPFDNVIAFEVAPNTGILPRQGRIRVESAGGAETLIQVNQGVCGLLGVDPPAPAFGADGTTGGAGDPAEIELLWSGETCSWTASTNTPWITLLVSSGTGAPLDNVILYDVAANTDTQLPRTGRITVTNGGGQVVQQVVITQGACDLVGPPPGPFLVGPDGLLLQEVQLNWTGASCTWTASTDVDWIGFINDSGSGAEFDNVLEFFVLANNETATARAANIVVLSESGEEYPILVQQQPCQLDAFNPAQFQATSAGLEDAQILLDWSGDECIWTASTNVPWVTLIIFEGTGVAGDNVVLFDVLPNNESSVRTGSVIVTGSNGTSQSIPIEQAASAGYEVSYTVVTGSETTPPSPARLEAVDDIPVSILAQNAAAGGSYQGLTYLSGGKITDIIFDTVYGGLEAPPPGVPFNVVDLQIRNRALSTSVSTLRIIYLRNRNTGAWESFATDTMPVGAYPNGDPPYQFWNLPLAIDPLRYVNPDTGRIQVRIWTVVLGNVSSNTVRHDYIWAGPIPQGGPEGLVGPGEDFALAWDESADDVLTQSLGDRGCLPTVWLDGALRYGPAGAAWDFFDANYSPDGCEWLAISESDWIEVLPRLVDADVFSGDRVEFVVKPFAGEAGTVRRGSILLISGDGATLRVPVVQGACEVQDPPEWQEQVEVLPGGDDWVEIPIHSFSGGCSWSVESESPWIRIVNPKGAFAEGDFPLAVLSVMANPRQEERVGVISVRWETGELEVIRVVQAGLPASASVRRRIGALIDWRDHLLSSLEQLGQTSVQPSVATSESMLHAASATSESELGHRRPG